MAQHTEQTSMYFQMHSVAEHDGWIDLAAAMSACNRKQYHQFTRADAPLTYLVQVSAIKSGTTIIFSSAPQSFVTANAAKMTAKGWKAQLKHAGVKLRDLPTYGRRPRLALERHAQYENTTGIADETVWEISTIHLEPLMRTSTISRYFGNYVASDQTTVSYKSASTPALGSIAANQITQVVVTDGETEAAQPLTLLGSGGGEFNVIGNYLKGRRSSPTYSEDTPGPTADSDMLNLFSVSEEQSDDVLDAVEEYMDWKPYNEKGIAGGTWDQYVELAVISHLTTDDTQYPPVSEVIDVPLGLLKVEAAAEDIFQVDVLMISEM